jgi:hypothetical protein
MPELLRILWPYVEGSMSGNFQPISDVLLYSLVVLFLNVYSIVFYNIVMYFIHTRKWSFFEQFRADSVTIALFRNNYGPGSRKKINGQVS